MPEDTEPTGVYTVTESTILRGAFTTFEQADAWARLRADHSMDDDVHLIIRAWEHPDPTTVTSHVLLHVYKGYATT